MAAHVPLLMIHRLQLGDSSIAAPAGVEAPRAAHLVMLLREYLSSPGILLQMLSPPPSCAQYTRSQPPSSPQPWLTPSPNTPSRWLHTGRRVQAGCRSVSQCCRIALQCCMAPRCASAAVLTHAVPAAATATRLPCACIACVIAGLDMSSRSYHVAAHAAAAQAQQHCPAPPTAPAAAAAQRLHQQH